MGHGERKVALSGDSVLFHYGLHGQQLADEGQLAANVYFVTGGSCAPVPGVIEQRQYIPRRRSDAPKRKRVRVKTFIVRSWGA